MDKFNQNPVYAFRNNDCSQRLAISNQFNKKKFLSEFLVIDYSLTVYDIPEYEIKGIEKGNKAGVL